MGIKTDISIKQINDLISNTNINITNIYKTNNGISDTTYIVKDKADCKYVFKIYEFNSVEKVCNEIDILNRLNNLPTPKPITKRDSIKLFKKKPTALFSYLKGISTTKITLNEISQIGLFLGKFHNQTRNMQALKQDIYSKNNIDILISYIKNSKNINNKEKDKILSIYNRSNSLDLSSNCIIHGDLFPDNTLFLNNKLSGVFDFAESSRGNNIFDLSVVVNNWCFDKNRKLKEDYLNTLLKYYNNQLSSNITKKDILPYIEYSFFFYGKFNSKFLKYIRNINIDIV
jgi:homoserine kinase type II